MGCLLKDQEILSSAHLLLPQRDSPQGRRKKSRYKSSRFSNQHPLSSAMGKCVLLYDLHVPWGDQQFVSNAGEFGKQHPALTNWGSRQWQTPQQREGAEPGVCARRSPDSDQAPQRLIERCHKVVSHQDALRFIENHMQFL